MRIQERAYAHVNNLTKGAAQEKVSQARLKVQQVLKFREEIEEEVIDLVKKQQALKDKITQRIHERKNSSGFLIHNLENYHKCLGTIDNGLLQSYLHEDLEHWSTIAKGTQRTQSGFKDRIEAFLKSQAEQLEELLLANTLSIATPQMRRLPILSTQHKSGKIDFEWPTESDLTEMVKVQVVKITKVEIWYY